MDSVLAMVPFLSEKIKRGTGSFDMAVCTEMHLLTLEHSKLIMSDSIVSCRPFLLIFVFTDV